MRVKVFQNKKYAGILEKDKNEYIFTYDDEFINDKNSQSISLTLPKTQKQYRSKYLFSFFHGLLSEGVNREIQCRKLKIDTHDYFQLLCKTANFDTIGNVTVEVF